MKQTMKTMMLAAAVALAGMAAFAGSDAIWTELKGSTSGKTLDSGYYFISANTTFSNATAGGSGLSIAEGAVVSIYVPAGVTLTATGAAGSGTTGGGAGILVPASAALNLIGSGTVKATGGAAAAGSDGKDGEMPRESYASIYPFSVQDRIVYASCWSGTGGAGGAGGGGGGAGIGTPGGTGGAGGAGGVGFGENGTDPWTTEIQRGNAVWTGGVYSGNGRAGVAGCAGSAAQTMGTLSIQSTIIQEISGGAASATAGTYVKNAANVRTGLGKNAIAGVDYRFYAYPGAGGGGGGSGYAGANIGTGGGGGGGGAGGQAGGVCIKQGTHTADWPQSYVGGGGTGNKNGTGSTSSSKIVKAVNESSIEDSYGGINKPADVNAVRYGGTGAGVGTAKAAGTADAPVYAVTYLDKDGKAHSSDTYAVGSATQITLPACEAGYKWVNTVYGKPCGEPSDLSSAPVAAFTGTIDARNVYGDLAFRATLNDVSVTLTAGEGEGYGFAVSNLTTGAEILVGEDGQYVLPAGAKVGIYAVAKDGYVILSANPLIIEKVDENTRNIVDSDLPRPTVSKPGSGEEPQKVIEKVAGDDGKTYTAVLENKSESGEVVENPVRAMSVEGLGEVASNKNTNVTLSVTPKDAKNVGQDVAEKIDSKLKEASEGKGFDSVAFVDLSVSFNAVKQENCELESVITLHIPWPVRAGGAYGVVRMHNGVAQMIPQDEGNAVDGEFFTVDFEKREIVLRVKKFSDYAIAETPPGVKVGENAYALVEDGNCTVYGTGATYNFSKTNPAPWAAFADQIKSVTIEPGVTQIGSRFFKGCTHLGTVTGGKDLISVGENAFYQCMSLETISLENAEVLDSLKNAVVYQTAIDAEGKPYVIPRIDIPGYKNVLYGTNDLGDPNSWQPVGSTKTMEESGYHFFKFVLKKIEDVR